MCRPRRSQLKTAGTQKVFPLSPLRTPLTPSQKNKECYPSLGGTGGTLFTQHYSCPAFLDAPLVLQVAAVGIFFRMWSIASIAQGQALRSIGKAATSLLPPSPPLYFSFQNECASYAGRSGRASVRSRRSADRWFFQLQSQTCHKPLPATRPLDIDQDCSFRMPLTKWKCFDEVLRTNWFVWNKNASSKAPLRQLSKVFDCFADACIWESSLRSELFVPSRRFATARWFLKTRGERAQRSKKFNPEQTKLKLHIVKLHVVFNLSILHIKIILILLKMCSARKI